MASIVERSADYTLARLEAGVRLPRIDLPPILPRAADASEEALRAQWGTFETRLEEIGRFVKRNRRDPAFCELRRIHIELDRYARALRWVLTVTERTIDEHQ